MIILLLLSIFANVFFVWHTSRLEGLVERQATILDNYIEIDSALNEGSEGLIDAINGFFGNIPTYKDGDQVSPVDFIYYHQSTLDSLRKYKHLYRYGVENYGLDIQYLETDTNITISPTGNSRADSANIALLTFRDRIKKIPNGWSVNSADYRDAYEEASTALAAQLSEHHKLRNSARNAEAELNYYEDLMGKLEMAGLISLDTLEDGRTTVSYIDSKTAPASSAKLKSYEDLVRKLKEDGVIKIDTLADGKVSVSYPKITSKDTEL